MMENDPIIGDLCQDFLPGFSANILDDPKWLPCVATHAIAHMEGLSGNPPENEPCRSIGSFRLLIISSDCRMIIDS